VRTLPIAALALVATSASAGPTEEVLGARLGDGPPALEARMGIERDRHGRSRWGAELGVAARPRRGWASELSAEFGRDGVGRLRVTALEWENRIALTAPVGPWHAAWLLAVEHAFDDDERGWALHTGPLLEWRDATVGARWNLLFERRLGEPAASTGLAYRWELRDRRPRTVAWGLQGDGELGRWNDWAPRAQQAHRIGPALFAQAPADISVGAALLAGLGGAAPRLTARVQVELPF